jgi:hypothetical membrane protein
MAINNSKIAGALLLVGSIQFVIALVIAEAVYPNYIISANYISDLGIWGKPSAAIFNFSIILFGSLGLVSSYFIKRHFWLEKTGYLFALAALGTLLVGLFPENSLLVNGFPVVHGIAALLVFTMGGTAAVATYKYTEAPFKIVTIILGAATLIAFVLFLTTANFGYFGLGRGGMERIVACPILLWTLSLGGYLLGS